jgi:hypothetical protein
MSKMAFTRALALLVGLFGYGSSLCFVLRARRSGHGATGVFTAIVLFPPKRSPLLLSHCTGNPAPTTESSLSDWHWKRLSDSSKEEGYRGGSRNLGRGGSTLGRWWSLLLTAARPHERLRRDVTAGGPWGLPRNFFYKSANMRFPGI